MNKTALFHNAPRPVKRVPFRPVELTPDEMARLLPRVASFPLRS